VENVDWMTDRNAFLCWDLFQLSLVLRVSFYKYSVLSYVWHIMCLVESKITTSVFMFAGWIFKNFRHLAAFLYSSKDFGGLLCRSKCKYNDNDNNNTNDQICRSPFAKLHLLRHWRCNVKLNAVSRFECSKTEIIGWFIFKKNQFRWLLLANKSSGVFSLCCR